MVNFNSKNNYKGYLKVYSTIIEIDEYQIFIMRSYFIFDYIFLFSIILFFIVIFYFICIMEFLKHFPINLLTIKLLEF
jgi:hypothetical protein